MNGTGFTGTQSGMTAKQHRATRTLFPILFGITGREFHHGDCTGADDEAHWIARECGVLVHVHPPNNRSKRAFCKGDRYSPSAPYLERNHHIVDATLALVATPKGAEELRSGTWSTVRYARKLTRPLYIVQPGGTVLYERGSDRWEVDLEEWVERVKLIAGGSHDTN